MKKNVRVYCGAYYDTVIEIPDDLKDERETMHYIQFNQEEMPVSKLHYELGVEPTAYEILPEPVAEASAYIDSLGENYDEKEMGVISRKAIEYGIIKVEKNENGYVGIFKDNIIPLGGHNLDVKRDIFEQYPTKTLSLNVIQYFNGLMVKSHSENNPSAWRTAYNELKDEVHRVEEAAKGTPLADLMMNTKELALIGYGADWVISHHYEDIGENNNPGTVVFNLIGESTLNGEDFFQNIRFEGLEPEDYREGRIVKRLFDELRKRIPPQFEKEDARLMVKLVSAINHAYDIIQ